MNEALRQTAIFVRDLLGYSESLIKIGRLNNVIDDFTDGLISVDSIGPAQRLASGESYDGDTETMTYQQQWLAPVTITFYGDGSWNRANEFALKIQSQQSLELQESQGIGVFQAGDLTDVKLLAGSQYSERLELSLNVRYSVDVDVSTLRIDEPQLQIQSEQGQENIP